jgi:hypothetical protein
MGHDIFAVDIKKDEAIVSFRRSAFDAYNRVLYVALEADEYYGGCSGTGDGREFTRMELVRAKEQLPYIVADMPPPTDMEFVEELKKQLEASIGAVDDDIKIECGPSDHAIQTIQEEERFLDETLEHMRVNKLEKVGIFFG